MDRNRGGAEIRRGGAPSGHKRRRLEQHQQQQQTQNQHFNSYSNFSSEEETEHRKQQEDEDDGAHGSPVVSRRASRSRNEEDEEEDDDDLPPPVIRHRATSSWKFKEETAGVDLAVTVPRKLRTAMMKRHQDSPPRHPTDTPAKKLKPLSNGTRLSNPAHSDSPPPPSIKSSSVKKTKPSVLSKPKEENQAKASPSKQELEIAETLFDLARMLSERPPSTTAAEDSKIAEKNEGKNEAEASNGSSMRSPQSPAVALPGTTTSQSTNANASYPGASKKKYHHSSKSKILDKSPIATSSISAPAAASSAPVAPVGRGKETVNDSQVHQLKDSTKPDTPVASELPVTNSSSGAAVNFPESQSTSQGKLPEKADAHVVANGNKIETNAQEYGDETSSSSPIAVTNDSIDASRSALATELTPKENATERLSNVLNAKVDDVTAKLDINKMDLPLNRHQTENEHLASNDSKEKEVLPNMEPEKLNCASSEEKNVDMERKSMVQHFANESKNSDFGSGYAQCGTSDRKTETHEEGEKGSATEFFIKIEQQINERVGETDAKINLDKASGQTAESIDLSLAPSPLVKTERNDRNPLSMSIGALGSSSKQIPAGKHIAGDLSMGLSVPTTEATTTDQKTASMLPSAHSSMALSWKHCATHVSICRFIDHEQQKSKFMWATASSKSANFCDSKSFFSSISLSPSLATIGKGLGDVKSASLILPPDLDSKVTDLALEPKKETVAAIDESASVEAHVMDKSANLNVDLFGRKASSRPQMENGQLQSMTSLQIGNPFGPASGQSASNPAVTVSGHNTVGMNSVMAFGGNTVPINGLSFGTGNNPGGNIPNIPQFQHPVMPHPTFPISFSPGQVALAGGAHVSSQQAQQFFSNAYYNPHLVQSLSSTSSHQQSASASAMNDTIKQSSNNFGNVCGFGSLGIQQISWPSFYGGQSLLPSGMQQQQGKENNADAVAGNELSSSKKNVYSPNLSFVHAPIMTSSSPVVTTTSMSSAHQDTNAMTTAMSKDATQQQKSDPHNHPQSHLMMPSLQMSLKDTEAHPSLSSNKVSGNSSLLGLPNMTSYMTPQGATFHGIGNQILFQEQFASGQSHQVMIPSSNNQQAMQTQKAVLNALENSRANLNDASKSGRGEDIKGSAKHQPYWDTQHAIQGTPTSGGYNLSNVSSGSVNVIASGTGDVSSLMYTNLSQFQNSKKQMARAKTPSTSVLSQPQAESTLITFSDRPTAHASNFANEPSGQIVFSAGQILDSSTHSRRQSNSSQMPQVKGNQRTQTPNTFSSASSQAMLTAMSRNQGHPSKTEQFWMDGGNPNSSRASPAPSVSSFSGSILPSSPTSKSGGGSTTPFGEKNLPKDSYSNQSRSSSVGPTEKKNPPSIIPNVASFLGSAAFSQNMSAMTFPIQMAPNPNPNQHQHQQQQQQLQQQQQQLQQLQQQQQTQQKKTQSKQQQRKQHKSSQSSQSTTSMQQQSLQMQQMQNPYYQMHQSANQKHQVQYSDRQQHPLNSAQNHALGDMHQHIKPLQNQERQQNTPTSGSASMQSQFENVQWQNLSHLHQHQQFFSTPFGMYTNGTLPAAPGSSADGATNNKRPSTPLNFGNSNTNMGSNSHRISMLQHGDYGPTRSDHSDKQQQ